jgi:hypothetical protein
MEQSLPVSLLFDHPTLDKLAGHLEGLLKLEAVEDTESRQPWSPQEAHQGRPKISSADRASSADSLLELVEGLSDVEVAVRMKRRAGGIHE